jgi:hypothetical protein
MSACPVRQSSPARQDNEPDLGQDNRGVGGAYQQAGVDVDSGLKWQV